MTIRNRTAAVLLALIAGVMVSAPPAWAHSFNVALIIPATPEGREIRDGFMLATTERDSHSDEESDGHLGGLDVYVTVIEADPSQLVQQGAADIVAIIGLGEMRSRIENDLGSSDAVLLTPGATPFSRANLPGVAAFIAAYERAYGAAPSDGAAEGYNAARRIDQAVRPLEGTDDRAALRLSFAETADDMTW